jgi:zinc-ribbon domain
MEPDQSPNPPAGFCSSCGTVVGPDERFCSRCGASVSTGGKIQVTGSNADEVLRVTKALVDQRAGRKNLASPWVSGSFYLFCFVVVMAVLLIAGNVLPPLALPILAIVGLLLFTAVGAFQQRHDERLSEKGFLQLMLATLRNLPLIVGRRDTSGPSE